MIYTSYFEAVRDFRDTNRLISIAFWTVPEFKHIQKLRNWHRHKIS